MTTNSNDQNPETALVLGGTGKTGRRIVEQLQARGVQTRVGSRSGIPPFDWEDRSTWESVLVDVQVAYLCFYPDLAVQGSTETVGAFARLAAERGVRRLVLLSGRGEPEAQRAEDAVRTAGTDFTIVRSSWFDQNFSENYMVDGVLAGTLALPVAAEVREPFIDADDVADIAVAALTDLDRHSGRTYEVTGPVSLTFVEAVAQIAAETGRGVAYQSVPLDAHNAELIEAGVPKDVVDLLTYLFTEVLDGRNAEPTDGVQQALGRPPRSFREFVRKAVADGAWAQGTADRD